MFDKLVSGISQKVKSVFQPTVQKVDSAIDNTVNSAYNSAAKFFPQVGNFLQKQYNNWQQKESNQLVTKLLKADLNKSLPGNQSIGGFGDFAGQATTNLTNQMPNWGTEMAQNASQDPSKFKRTLGGFVGNQIVQPALDIPENLNKLFNPTVKATPVERGLAGLMAAGGALPGVDDATFMAYNAAKNKLRGGSLEKGFTGDEYAGLGSLTAPGTSLETPLNIAELPLLFLAGGIKPKQLDEILSAGKRVDEAAQLAKEATNVPTAPKQAVETITQPRVDVVKPEVTTNFFKPKGSKQPDFIAGAEGVTPVRSVGSKKLEELFPVKTEKVSDEVLGLPQGEIKKAAEAAAKETAKFQNLQGVPKSGIRKTWDALVPSSRRVIETSSPAGKEIVNLLDQADVKATNITGVQQADLYTVLNKLTKQEKSTLADVIEGNVSPISVNQENAARVWRTIADDISQRSKQAGIETGYLEKYFPHHILKDAKSSEARMATRGLDRRYGNLELSRQSDLPYDKDPAVLYDYIEKANKRIANVETLGRSDEAVYQLTDEIAKQGGDANQVRKYLDQILGKNQSPEMEALSRGVRNVESFKLGPTSALTNLTQNLSTAMRTDIPTITRTIAETISDPDTAIKNAIRAGEIDPAQGARILSEVGDGSIISKWLKLVGFSGAEKINRVIAVNSGINYSNKLIKQAKAGSVSAVRELERLGFDVKNLDKIDTLEGGRAISQATQFSTKVGELPYGWQTPIGRIFSQFKGFGYKQLGFLGNETKRIAQEASNGNLKPLVNSLTVYGVAAPIVGELINDIKSIITNKERTSEGKQRYIENILGATSLGLLDSLSGLTGKYGASGVVGTVAGPAVGDIAKTGEVISQVASGDKYEQRKAARTVLRQIPGIGPTLANTFVPNAYVDNYIGQNQGLNDEETKTYNQLKQTNPQKAEEFKQNKQQTRLKKGEEGIASWFKPKQNPLTLPEKPTKDDIKTYNTDFDNFVEAGGVPTEEQIKNRFFSKEAKTVKDVNSRYSQLDKILTGDYEQGYKDAAIKASGLKKEDVDYYQASSLDNSERRQLLVQAANQEDRASVIITLAGAKRIVGNKSLASSEDIDYLYDMGVITKDEKALINSFKFDEATGKFYQDRDFKGSGKKKKKITMKDLFPMSGGKLEVPKTTASLKTPEINYKSMPKSKKRLAKQWFRV